jgi:dUTP pyrophosphatase
MWLKAVEEVDPQGTDPIAFLVEDGGTLPTRANNGDAGFDLYTSEDTLVPAGEFVDVPCGVRVAFPPGMWGRIAGRSSTLRKRGLLVAEGIIDTGYRGPLYAGVRNLEDEDKWVRKGERIAQLIPHDNVATNHHAVEIDRGLFARIPGDGRGEAGFGSSGN